MISFTENIVVKLRYYIGRLSKIIEKVPPEYKEQFEQELLKNSVFRIRFLAVFLFIHNIIKRLLLLKSVNTYEIFFSLMASGNGIFNHYIKYGFLVAPFLFLVFTGIFSRKKNTLILFVPDFKYKFIPSLVYYINI